VRAILSNWELHGPNYLSNFSMMLAGSSASMQWYAGFQLINPALCDVWA